MSEALPSIKTPAVLTVYVLICLPVVLYWIITNAQKAAFALLGLLALVLCTAMILWTIDERMAGFVSGEKSLAGYLFLQRHSQTGFFLYLVIALFCGVTFWAVYRFASLSFLDGFVSSMLQYVAIGFCLIAAIWILKREFSAMLMLALATAAISFYAVGCISSPIVAITGAPMLFYLLRYAYTPSAHLNNLQG